MLDGKYNASESEKKWQDFWEKNGVYKFNPNSQKIYSIDTPPPTVSGHIHIGHVFSYSQAEFIARYWRMKGYNIFYPFGFDDNGLPTERLVEKEHKVKANKMSREDFTKLCLETTKEFEGRFKELFKSLGFSVDWSLEYSTISIKSRKTSQKSFLDLYKKGKAYYSESPALWCTECQTSIAQAEIDIKTLESTFNFLRFKVAGENDELIIATTRPELLPACVCILVNPNDKEKVKYIGKQVEVPIFGFKVNVIADEKVDIDKGSGVVMCCTFGDMTDVEWYKKYNLPLKKVITNDGYMEKSVPIYSGMKVAEAKAKIIEDLTEKEFLIKSECIEHNVATHERCGTPIEFVIARQWFIKTLENKELFIEAGNKINWYPTFMKDRYINWVENLQWDWCISRQRYFGVPFPVWYCKDCGEIIIAEEKDLPVNPLVDKPSKNCNCGCSNFIPESDVLDTWATSSVTQLINSGWTEKDNLMDKIVPMSMRPNAHEIIRTWDFYSIIKNIYHLGVIPWKNLMISGFVLAGKGDKISKSKGNSKHSPDDLIREYSADVVRYLASSGRLGSDIVFSEEELRSGTKLITKIWNASKFVLMHLSDYDNRKEIEILPMDQIMLSKVSKLVKESNIYLEKYEVGLALNNLENFFWDFCDNYIEIVKDRLYKPEIYGESARLSGQKTVYLTLLNLLKLFAIYFPHITEEIYQVYFKEKQEIKSIHLCKIDDFEYKEDDKLIDLGENVLEIISKARKYKSERNLSLKTELNELIIYGQIELIQFSKSVEYDIKSTCNCKNIKYIEHNSLMVEIN